MQTGKRQARITLAAFCILAVAAAFYLFTEHRAHALGALPYLIFLLCPLMHLFMHRSHPLKHGANEERESVKHDGDDHRH